MTFSSEATYLVILYLGLEHGRADYMYIKVEEVRQSVGLAVAVCRLASRVWNFVNARRSQPAERKTKTVDDKGDKILAESEPRTYGQVP